MKVISLFDGMSCGMQALKELNIPVKSYDAFEIDKYAIQISLKNHPEIKQHGSVVGADFAKFKGYDLLIGGSPCQGFSFAGKQLAFDDPRSALFFEFVRALKEIQPKYFLLENVKMKKEHLEVISDQLGVQPVFINSALVSAQNRQRFYWANFPITQPKDLGITLQDINICGVGAASRGRYLLDGSTEQKIEVRKDAKSNALTSVGKDSMLLDGETLRNLTPIECERLQTLPDNYTEGVSNSQRYHMLGNGWTVAVIKHILEGIDI